jgi:hypothetical protein
MTPTKDYKRISSAITTASITMALRMAIITTRVLPEELAACLPVWEACFAGEAGAGGGLAVTGVIPLVAAGSGMEKYGCMATELAFKR